jgi:hypothetical protein
VSSAGRYAKFVIVAVLVIVEVAAVGAVPTMRLGGKAAMPAMAVGSAISLVGAAMAGWPLALMRDPTPTVRMQTAMLAMAVRLAVVLGLGLAAALSGLVPRQPLLLWLAVSYVVLLPLEVKLAVKS